MLLEACTRLRLVLTAVVSRFQSRQLNWMLWLNMKNGPKIGTERKMKNPIKWLKQRWNIWKLRDEYTMVGSFLERWVETAAYVRPDNVWELTAFSRCEKHGQVLHKVSNVCLRHAVKDINNLMTRHWRDHCICDMEDTFFRVWDGISFPTTPFVLLFAVVLLSVGIASAQMLQPSILNGKPYYDFPQVESLNGGELCNRYLEQAGTTEGALYYALRELAWRVERLENKVGK